MNFSIIVPTRKRLEGLASLINSFVEMTCDLSNLEIILVIDSDDDESSRFECDDINIKKVIVEPGANMGALNMEGYKASTGKNIMLLNDDVVIKTHHWDIKILNTIKQYSDEIVLIHVNDGIFKEKLCTFPLLVRTYTEMAGGICPADYERYRIDDHIYNVFNLLALVGKKRIVYLPDVLFEHNNYEKDSFGKKTYIPDESIHKKDTIIYEKYFEERKKLASKLKVHINNFRQKQYEQRCKSVLDLETDSLSMRNPYHIRYVSDNSELNSQNTRVTIGVVTANINSSHAKKCINRLKKCTSNYELILVDNNGADDFNHAREMNRLLSMASNDYLVLMDDDVFVEPNWLNKLLGCINEKVGVVTPLHNDINGKLSYSGIIMDNDGSGHHKHLINRPNTPSPIMTLCSAIMLIDLNKCGHIRVDDSYSKYFLDIDYGLRIWEAGYEVICEPSVMVTHVGGATLPYETKKSAKLFEKQRKHYVSLWIDTGRYESLIENRWKGIKEIQSCLNQNIEKHTKLFPIGEVYKGHNIVTYKGVYYGISEAYKLLTEEKIDNNNYLRLIKGSTESEVKQIINKKIYPKLLVHGKDILYYIRPKINKMLFIINYFFKNMIFKVSIVLIYAKKKLYKIFFRI